METVLPTLKKLLDSELEKDKPDWNTVNMLIEAQKNIKLAIIEEEKLRNSIITESSFREILSYIFDVVKGKVESETVWAEIRKDIAKLNL